jgi:tetratricopeptide (TPR) repeat protein
MPKPKDRIRRIQHAVFTGRADELSIFRALLPSSSSPAMSISILALHGMGGIGKSELLNQYQRIAAESGVALARLDAQVQKGIFDFLTTIHQQLKPHLRFPEFEEGWKRRQEIEDKLLRRGDIPKNVLQMFSRGAHIALKMVPGVNLAAEMISPEHIEAAIGTIYSAVGRNEGDFWMKPEEELTDRLISDLYPYTEQRRLVLMFDTYELIGEFDDWVRDRLFGNLGEHTLLVIAGRRRLEGTGWQEYAPLTRQIELGPLSMAEAQEYLEKMGITDPRVAAEMADYTDGLPLTLMMLAGLAQQVDIGKLDLTKAPERRQVIQDLLTRITQNVAQSLRSALEVCAILRVVTEDSLEHMLGQQNTKNTQYVFAELRRFDFMKLRNDGIALHDAVWAAMNEELSWRTPAHFRDLNFKAAQFYERELSEGKTEQRERYSLERLYHLIRADETRGIKLFQQLAEESVRYHRISWLRTLLTDISDYLESLELENNRLWCLYYQARLAHLEVRLSDAMSMYEMISTNDNAEPKLRAHALCDLGAVLAKRQFSSRPGGAEKAVHTIEQGLAIMPALDVRACEAYIDLANAYRRHIGFGTMEKALASFDMALQSFKELGDPYGEVVVLGYQVEALRVYGDWGRAFKIRKQGLSALSNLQNSVSPSLRQHIIGGLILACLGRFHEGERDTREQLSIRRSLGEVDLIGPLRDLGFVLGFQDKFDEANATFAEYENISDQLQQYKLESVTGLRMWGAVLLRQGRYSEAAEKLSLNLKLFNEADYVYAHIECYCWLGLLSERQNNLDEAESYFASALQYRWVERRYFECFALVGLTRVKHLQADYVATRALFSEAEPLAQQYEYNDHMASLRLTQGHASWGGHVAEWGSGFEVALSFYKQALIYALRYNRFLLDEILTGRPQGTSLRPIIPYCLERGEAGQRMLVALTDWWQVGTNDLTTRTPSSVSPIPEGIQLMEAESIAREREPGEGLVQKSVLAQIAAAL